MKILIISHQLPNQYNRIRLKNTIKALQNNHQVKVLHSTKSRLFSYLSIINNILKPLPFEATYCLDHKLKNQIQQIYSQYDLIIVKRLRTAVNLPQNIHIPIIIDSTDAMSLYYKQGFTQTSLLLIPLFLHEYLTYLLFEKYIANNYQNIIVCSESDQKYLQQIMKNKIKISVIPNVVDTSLYKTRKKPDPNTILFSGLMNKQVNILAIKYFISKIWPKIISTNPNLKFYIVGPNPPNSIKRLASSNIIITGNVTNIKSYIEKASVIIAPITLGTGTRNKILQAWAMNRPVVSTPLGIQGLNAVNNKHALITKSPDQFAQYILAFLNNKSLSQKITNAALKHVTNNYNLASLNNSYTKLFKSL